MTMQSPAHHSSSVFHQPAVFSRLSFAALHQFLRRTLEAEMLRKRHEAMLRSLDRRTLLDIGIAIDDPEERLGGDPHRDSPNSLGLLFSLTRFGK